MRGSSSLSNSLASCFLVAARVGRDQPLRRDLDEIWMISDEGLLFFLEMIKIEVEPEIARQIFRFQGSCKRMKRKQS